MQINYILLGQRIRAFRTKKGITQMELAERIDRSAAYMSYVETAYKSCSLDTLVMVANELNVSTDDLLIDSLTNTIRHPIMNLPQFSRTAATMKCGCYLIL